MSVGPPADVVRVRRQPGRARYDRASVQAVLDGGLDAHVVPVVGGYGTATASPGLRPAIPLAPSVERLLAAGGR